MRLAAALLTFFVAMMLTAATCADEWKPAKGPLMTRWAKDVSPDNALPEHPRPQMVRSSWINLNGLWQLDFAAEGDAPPVGKELSEQILVPFPVESALSGVMKRGKRLWYRRTFDVPDEWDGQRVLLHFGAVDWEATVLVNGTKVGVHRGGYDSFTLDVTAALTDDGPQELIVGVFDPTNDGPQPRGKQVNNPHGIWYTPTTGIWQTVWLEAVPPTHVMSLTMNPDVDGKQLELTVNVLGADKPVVVEAVATTDGKQVAVNRVEVEPVDGRAAVPVSVPLSIAEPKLWWPDDPFLYELQVTVRRGDEVIDQVDSYFGMRKVSLGKDDQGRTRMMLNDEPVFQVGPLDQGFWPDGLYTAPTDEALRYDIEVTKQLGFNMARKHVKIEPARWYYWCDKLGLLVWQDMPSGDNHARKGQGEIERRAEAAQQFERELERLVAGRGNHPSIIMWVVFNEGWGQYDTVRLTNWTKKLDPNRLVCCASGWNDFPVGDIIDVHAYPGPASKTPTDTRAAVLGEFGGLKLAVEGHMWSKESWGYRTVESSEQLMQRYENLLRAAWRLQDTHGTSALVYTQTTDVEIEANGVMTYDRAVTKLDVERAYAANRGQFPELKTLVPDSRAEGQPWRYTTDEPADGWTAVEFDDSSWKQGVGGFGQADTPGAVVRTEWTSDDIYLRREVTLPDGPLDDLMLTIHHDEDARVYVNGKLVAETTEYTTSYIELRLSPEAAAAFRPGKNIIAVHCRQTRGGQYIDVGLGRLVPRKK